MKSEFFFKTAMTLGSDLYKWTYSSQDSTPSYPFIDRSNWNSSRTLKTAEITTVPFFCMFQLPGQFFYTSPLHLYL